MDQVVEDKPVLAVLQDAYSILVVQQILNLIPKSFNKIQVDFDVVVQKQIGQYEFYHLEQAEGLPGAGLPVPEDGYLVLVSEVLNILLQNFIVNEFG